MTKFISFLTIVSSLFILGCGSSDSNTTTVSSAKAKVMAAGGDFAVSLGLIYGIDSDNKETIVTDSSSNNITPYQDSIIKSYNNKFYIFDRDSNAAVIVLDGSTGDQTPIANYSLAETDPDGNFNIDGGFNGPNTYDIAFKSEAEAYVCFYNSTSILKINPLTGERKAKIDVSFINDMTTAGTSDASAPNIVDVELIGDYLYILAQRQDASFTALKPVMVIYDITKNSFVDLDTSTTDIDGIVLTGKNPNHMIYITSKKQLYISHSGLISYASDFSSIESTEAGTAGIEAVDTTLNSSLGMIVSGMTISGTSDSFSVKKIIATSNQSKAYIVFGAFDFSTNLKELTLTDNTVSPTSLLSNNSSAFGDVTIDDNGQVYQIERDTTSPSIQVIDSTDGSVLKSISTLLPLSSITVLK
ncbi:MAG: hypothetical protein COA79_26175 [Planctomycetota bacterium]|nr:MAG: hypothetical protein COA79_26175 [Planctomycetota bacterium]